MQSRKHTHPCAFLTFSIASLLAPPVFADGGVAFHDIARGTDPALTSYHRTESATAPLYREFTEAPAFTFFELEDTPNKWRGAPGVALLDYDRDGDLDLYVTNGPGSDNSLFHNQLRESGTFAFVDVAAEAGVAAPDQDSSGVCFGDVDNDGDPDLLVVSPFDAHRLFENNGDGTFTDVSAASGIHNDEGRTAVGCSFGDVDGDGLLDVAVANNNLDWTNLIGIGPMNPLAAWHNQIFKNLGGNAFADVSAASGIEVLDGWPAGGASVTWAVALVDMDLDGDVDLVQADDSAFLHLFENDGTGHFTDVAEESGVLRLGNWMGLSFGDLDGDGTLDFFGSNVGDWNVTLLTPLDPVYANIATYELGDRSSRWFLGSSDGTWSDPGVGGMVATAFAFGTSMADYDNDADTDIMFYGGLAFPPMVIADNPGTIAQNDGAANFVYDLEALAGSTDHRRRVVDGLALGDLDDDGFVDVVSVSGLDVQESIPIPDYKVRWGSALDGIAAYQQLWVPTETPLVWAYSGAPDNADGTLSVEISDAANGNNWAKVRLLGSVGITTGGQVNRDGIGAVVSVLTKSGKQTMRPVTGGSSYASQDSLELGFGMGEEHRVRIEVLWPGGVRNRFYDARPGERLVLPEIPCSFAGEWESITSYISCVRGALDELEAAGAVELGHSARLFEGAMRAYLDENVQ